VHFLKLSAIVLFFFLIGDNRILIHNPIRLLIWLFPYNKSSLPQIATGFLTDSFITCQKVIQGSLVADVNQIVTAISQSKSSTEFAVPHFNY